MTGVAVVLFSDLVNSTALLASLGDDRMDGIRRSHVRDVTEAVVLNDGRVIKTLGDGVMASFDSALGALRAAAAIQAAVERLDGAQRGIGIAARVGVAAGEPIADGDDLHGMSVVIASRLSSAAGTGEVLVHGLVQALVASRDGLELEPLGEYTLKGIPTPVQASRLRWRELANMVEEGAAAETLAASRADNRRNEPTRPPDPGAIRLPPPLAAFGDEPLIGRDLEIDRLREASKPRDVCRAVLILGEPGIGKTRHAAAVAAEAHAEGSLVVLARCQPDVTVPFEPWVRAVGELALAGDDAWRAELTSAAGPELAALVPELSEHATLADRVAADEIVAAEGARYRLFRGIAATLAFAAGEASLHVVIDDAHWCDPASAQALAHLLESAPGRLVLVVTARDRELGRRHPVSKVLSNLRRTDDLAELRLVGLDASDLAALVGAKVGRAITPDLAAQLQARTSGNPFFAGELARDLDAQGTLRAGKAPPAAPAPEAVTDLVEERLGRLSPETERLLVAVAAIGPAAPVALAAEVAGLGSEQVERGVAEALSERLVDEVVAAEPTIAFPHALIREALTAGIGDADRARLHLAIARALEQDPDIEPGELARHYQRCVGLAGREPAIAVLRAAATAAAEAHDHEQAAAHLHSLLALMPGADSQERISSLLELGEQELLCADLVRARRTFGEAAEIARLSGDPTGFARAALGFAGGDVGFGWESSSGDPAAIALLQEALAVLGDGEPRLALRMIFRVAYLSAITGDQKEMAGLVERANELGLHLGDPEAELLARFTELVSLFLRSPDPLRTLKQWEDCLDLVEPARECGREELLFRVVQTVASSHYIAGRVAECEQAMEWAEEIAHRLGSPRFAWEIDLNRGMRFLDRGDREGGEALVRRAGSVVRRLRPDIQMQVEATALLSAEWVYDGETGTSRLSFEALQRVNPTGFVPPFIAMAAALEGDRETALESLRTLLAADCEPLRGPDGYFPMGLWALAYTATHLGDREACARLRPLLEPLRSHLVAAAPGVGFGHLPEWHIGRLELLAGRLDKAIEELRAAVARAQELEIVWAEALARIDLARALHHRGDAGGAVAALAEGEGVARRFRVGWALRNAAEARAEIERREPPPPWSPATERSRPIRAIASRRGRRALAAMVGGLDDAELERRFAEPRRQRALAKAQARGFQPAQANGFSGVLAYEIEPYAIEPPHDAPWRWAIAVDAVAGRARLIEPAPLNAAVTIHIGLADWVRAAAGLQDAVTAMVDGRCSVEGDIRVAVRLEGMFGGQ
jgi:class 3 adenylate cyclase/tetratricopeptide (TPR) repeat protein